MNDANSCSPKYSILHAAGRPVALLSIHSFTLLEVAGAAIAAAAAASWAAAAVAAAEDSTTVAAVVVAAAAVTAGPGTAGPGAAVLVLLCWCWWR